MAEEPGRFDTVKEAAGGRIERMRLFLSEVRNELKRVTWPSQQEVYATTVVVMDFSYSITGSTYRLIVNGLRKIAAAGNPVAVVGFSDVAYEMLPPGTPARELDSIARRFIPLPTKDGSVEFPSSPWSPLEGGTRISQGLELAGQILQRDHVRKGSVVLISDLETSSDD